MYKLFLNYFEQSVQSLHLHKFGSNIQILKNSSVKKVLSINLNPFVFTSENQYFMNVVAQYDGKPYFSSFNTFLLLVKYQLSNRIIFYICIAGFLKCAYQLIPRALDVMLKTLYRNMKHHFLFSSIVHLIKCYPYFIFEINIQVVS